MGYAGRAVHGARLRRSQLQLRAREVNDEPWQPPKLGGIADLGCERMKYSSQRSALCS